MHTTCQICNNTLTGRQRETCSKRCRITLDGRKRRAAGKAHTYTYPCIVCSKDFSSKVTTAMREAGNRAQYCSKECSNSGISRTLTGTRRVTDEMINHRRTQRRIESRWKRASWKMNTISTGSATRTWVAGQCNQCGVLFVSNQPGQVSCSKTCTVRRNKAKRRAVKLDAFVANVSPREIHERDGWCCRLCGKPVERGTSVPHPSAPVIDHIIPLAKGGTHEPGNVQTAHFMCNSMKGDRSSLTAEQMQRVA